MADAPAMPSSPPASAGDGNPSSPSVPVPRMLPSRMFLDIPPPSSGRARGPRGGSGRAAAASGSGGRKREFALPAAPATVASYGSGGRRPNRLVDAVMKLPTDADARLASADILELAMAKGPMFEWLSYWPENGFPNEDHPY